MASLQFQISLRDLAARWARVLQKPIAQKSEGAGNAGCPMHPQPRMQNKTSIRASHHGHTGTTRHSPRNGFTAYFALSSVTTLFDTVACASSHRLDAKDWGVGTTRLRRTQAVRARLARCPRPPHPAPR